MATCKNGTVIHLRLPAELDKRVRTLAKSQDRSMAYMARLAMALGMDKAEQACGYPDTDARENG